MELLLKVNSLNVSFKIEGEKAFATEDISFDLCRGKTLGIVGESGSGKSVTSLAIMRLLPKIAEIKSGTIEFYSKEQAVTDLLQLSSEEIRKYRGKRIAMIFQEPMTSLNPVYRCGKQVAEAIALHEGLDANAAKKRTLELFEEVLLPNPLKAYNAYPHELSGGQKQRVMIAMAISCNPDLLIADEPTTALDVTVQKSILELLRTIQLRHNMGMIFITHDLGVIADIADDILVMYKGRVVEYGTKTQVLKTPSHAYTKSLIACRPKPDTNVSKLPVISDFLVISPNGDIEEKNVDINSFAEHIDKDKARERIYANEPILKVQHVNTEYITSRNWLGKVTGSYKALKNISFDVYKGETLGLVGESGCGKTTLGRTLVRLINANSGNIIYKDKDLTQLSKTELKAFRKSFQIIFQDPYSSLNPRLTVGEALIEPLIVHNIYNTEKERKQAVIAMMEKVGLQETHFYRYPHEFSGGQRQRIVIARALMLNPEFVICDESVSALDVSVQAQVLNLLNELKAEFGFTYIFISHDLSVVKFMSDRIIVMNKGEIAEMGYADEIYRNPQSPYTQRLLSSIPVIGG